VHFYLPPSPTSFNFYIPVLSVLSILSVSPVVSITSVLSVSSVDNNESRHHFVPNADSKRLVVKQKRLVVGHNRLVVEQKRLVVGHIYVGRRT